MGSDRKCWFNGHIDQENIRYVLDICVRDGLLFGTTVMDVLVQLTNKKLLNMHYIE